MKCICMISYMYKSVHMVPLHTTYKQHYGQHIVTMFHQSDEIGEFIISGTFDTGTTCSMSIHVDDAWIGKGISRLMIRSMIQHVTKVCPSIRADQLLFIDVDASDGFWTHIGMKNNRYGIDYKGRRICLEGKGYEKYMTWRQLECFCR